MTERQRKAENKKLDQRREQLDNSLIAFMNEYTKFLHTFNEMFAMCKPLIIKAVCDLDKQNN